MALITYENKVAINENSQVADINKVTASDINEIKSVVNQNYNDFYSEVQSNDNGTYVKKSDGTLICYGVQTFSVNISDFWNMKASEQVKITYPINFKENTGAVINVLTGNNIWIIYSANSPTEQSSTTQSQAFRFMHPTGQKNSSDSITVFYIAIGKWK